MPVSFRIFPRRGLCFVRYEGATILDETETAFAEYLAHPDFQPGQKQLVDLSAVTGWDRDFIRMFKMQARKAEALFNRGPETLLVYYAPTRISREMARMIHQSWEGVAGVVVRIQDDQAGALALVGQPETRIADIMAAIE